MKYFYLSLQTTILLTSFTGTQVILISLLSWSGLLWSGDTNWIKDRSVRHISLRRDSQFAAGRVRKPNQPRPSLLRLTSPRLTSRLDPYLATRPQTTNGNVLHGVAWSAENSTHPLAYHPPIPTNTIPSHRRSSAPAPSSPRTPRAAFEKSEMIARPLETNAQTGKRTRVSLCSLASIPKRGQMVTDHRPRLTNYYC